MVELTIDGRKYKAQKSEVILDVARRNGIHIPTLCFHDCLEGWGACRLCMVEITKTSWDGWSKLVTSCLYPVEQGLIISSASEKVLLVRRTVLDLLLARCPGSEMIQELAAEYDIEDTSFHALVKDDDCILCGLCVRLCEMQGTSAIATINRGVEKVVDTPFSEPNSDCIGCLVCARNCPTGNIDFEESPGKRKIWGSEFDLNICPVCGKAHITVPQAYFYAKKSGLPVEYFEKCDECRRKETARKFTDLLVES